jgi:hypothetical protein
MMFSICVMLGVFLLLAIRNPLANRTLIALAPPKQHLVAASNLPNTATLIQRLRQGEYN